MIDVGAWFAALGAIATAAALTWIVSVFRRDVSIVDSLWSLLFLLAVLIYVGASESAGPRAWLIVVLVAVWALRLSGYITVRNHGEPEDRRYQAIRRNNQPHFWLKSLYIVFGLQAFLAWLIALPAVAAAASPAPLGWLDLAAVLVWAAGMYFEVVGDWQLMLVILAVLALVSGFGFLAGSLAPLYHPHDFHFNLVFFASLGALVVGAGAACALYFGKSTDPLADTTPGRALAAGLGIDIVPGILPVFNFVKVSQFASKCGEPLPRWLIDRFAAKAIHPLAAVVGGFSKPMLETAQWCYARRPDLRFPLPKRFGARLEGRRIEALDRRGLEYARYEGEAAFYGPKVDFQFRSVIEREFTVSTNQLDFAVPPRFGLTYTDRDGSEKTPYCIHRAPLSTHERFIAFLIEQAGGFASTGRERVMEVEPTSIHQRCPLIFGSASEVRLVEHYYAEAHALHERPPLFGERGLFRTG